MTLAFWKRPSLFDSGIHFASGKLLQGSIILLGFEMNLYNVLAVGSRSIYIIFFTLSAAFITAWGFGRYLKLSRNTSILIGVGTAICGGSAIAATAPVISATEKDVAHSLSTIFLFNIVAVLLFPYIGHQIGLSDVGFGMWAGTAINDTSSVVAAGYSFSNEAGNFATIVKLTRALMIIPITVALAVYTSRISSNTTRYSFVRTFPWFILGFIAASVVCTAGVVSSATAGNLAQGGKFFIIMAMTAIGLKTPFKNLIHNGVKPLLLGLFCWIAVALVSIISQHYLLLW
jgi:uncharacterized integral membrane protein (TIGR00698 family)